MLLYYSIVCKDATDCFSSSLHLMNSRFNKRILRSHPNVWAFIECLKKEEVVSRQMMLKFTNDDQKKKTKAILALEVRLKTLSNRFENGEIDRKQYLEALSFFVADKK